MNSLVEGSESSTTLFVDRDGTLVGTCNANFNAYNAALKHFRISTPTELKEHLHLGQSWETISKEIFPNLEVDILEKIHHYKTSIFPSYFSQLNWNEEVIQFISGYQWALVSNGSTTSSLQILSRRKYLTPFAVVGPTVTLRPKPNPDMFISLLTRQDLRLNTVLVLEDSSTGCEAARLAGLDYTIVPHLC